MAKTYIFGHKNPDTDAISSAIIMADFEQQTGNAEATPFRLGEIGPETQYALDQFKVSTPALLSDDLNDQNVILVDHNEFQQSADTIDKASIKHVVDHHRISNFETAAPLYYRAEPVGCTATILYKMYKERGFEIKPEIAGLMISAIISDSLLFKSPTCTQEDIEAAEALKSIANVDLEAYGLEMLKAGASTTDKTATELLNMDAKSFNMGDYITRIGQVNTVDINEVFERQEELEKEMLEVSTNEKYDLFVLLVTDIINSDSKILVVGAEKDKVGSAFNVQLENNTAFLPGVVSRKKQVVPQITEALS
ncbi:MULTISPECIES: manganese-dependent inorganic pyrophosphatase [Staphylococcus]|jgi:manganese-dependent inorganic pyrophosphatase|uniref:Probable manganese-dependent inorganic pyrophosphatase n=1 Tax=Staphylococcus nepalensis TaxID=214473 RepID=A0A291JII3_9STAP|nr:MULTISPECIES: manganese-dependent inorganic pyrophosphatase [Staphylococcus]VDG66651.1 manganese-dependent inorganic pyrophosphatase [Lacrimispora indolis]ATH59694.1 manganese-dependent inorganic pyrophosphatase [Staphylococcus nepalensis]ATH64785.1 manganese-dependent inorganic pyrophosphatase [Staphylococcus nepalensis]AWI44153.1 manganese-dependent inorganic pyrophosphatase [Staphylococcus nepalensis]MBO1206882.1 manganese-dependent inorganic pyrophosphatase [Staphylococcus nepalensis]